jgi:aldehyde:ferredoxin oxidoreductase
MYGWQGKILHIDLTKGKTWTEEFESKLGELFLGGRGINAKFLWDLIAKPGIDPLGPENVLIFGTGALNGHYGTLIWKNNNHMQRPNNTPLPQNEHGWPLGR